MCAQLCDFAWITNSVVQWFQANPKRDPNYNWKYGFLTFEEHLNLAQRMGFAIIPEIKQAYATNKVRLSRDQDSDHILLRALSYLAKISVV